MSMRYFCFIWFMSKKPLMVRNLINKYIFRNKLVVKFIDIKLENVIVDYEISLLRK